MVDSSVVVEVAEDVFFYDIAMLLSYIIGWLGVEEVFRGYEGGNVGEGEGLWSGGIGTKKNVKLLHRSTKKTYQFQCWLGIAVLQQIKKYRSKNFIFLLTRYTIHGGKDWQSDEFHEHIIKVDGVLNEAEINTLAVR